MGRETIEVDEGLSIGIYSAERSIIRQPQSWIRSDAWRILAGYTGRLLIIAGENDPIIPRDVIQRIYHSAVNASERQLYIAPNASHFVFTDLRAKNPGEFDRVFDLICKMLRDNHKHMEGL